MRKRNGNLNNVRICNGRFSQVLANVSGVLAVQCLENNVGHVRPSAGGLNFNISVEIPKHISSRDSTDTNGGITTLVEVWTSHDPNVTIPIESSINVATNTCVDGGTEVNIF